MKTETLEFEIKSAYGKDLPKPLTVKTTFEAYESREEIPDGKRLNDEQYLQAVVAREKAKVRAKATADALAAAGIEKPDQNDPDVIRENMIRSNMKLYKVSEDVARQIQANAEATAKALAAAAQA